MKRSTSVVFVISLMIIAGSIEAGCVQSGGNIVQQSPSGILLNVTQLNETATKLGVTGESLQKALNSTVNGVVNLTIVAKQFNITPQQLTATVMKLGITNESFREALNSTVSRVTNLTTAKQFGTP